MKRSDVQHMKWWGWGLEGHSFTHEDKPKLAAFIRRHLDIDVRQPVAARLAFEDLDVPASRLGDDLRRQLVEALGEDNVVTDDMDRVVHAYGKGVRDLLRIRRGELGRTPDVVVYPGTQEEVQALVDLCVEADAVLIPFGGGSNIVAATEAVPGEERQVVSVDMGRMNQVLELDEESGLARIQAGVLGPDMEAQLAPRGWTMGHFPDSFTHSTLGGWIATRSSGMQSDKYGDIADIVKGMTVVLPGRVLTLRPTPSASNGPSVPQMIVGSEGRLGIITEAWVSVHRIPEVREIQAYFFPTYRSGIEAIRDIAASDAAPSVARVSDEAETSFSMATGKKSSALSHAVTSILQKVLTRKGFDVDNMCLSFIGFEGSRSHVAYERTLVGKIVKAHGGVGVGTGPGALYDQKKFDTPYIRDFLLDYGAVADVSESATPWSKMVDLHDTVVKRFYETLERLGKRGYIMCHESHSYHSGACQYFTFAINDSGESAEASYDAVKQMIQSTFVEMGGGVSHHHGVGEEHAPWMEQDISEAGVFLQRTLLEGADPGRNLNPGKILHDGEPGVSTNSPRRDQ